MEDVHKIGVDWPSLRISQGCHLPHWQCAQAIYHSVFGLTDSLPVHVVADLEQEQRSIRERIMQFNREATPDEIRRLTAISRMLARVLDAGHGVCWLKDPAVAKAVADVLVRFDGQRYRLHAWCVMPNHVHAVVEPLDGRDVIEIVGGWKRFSAIAVNRLLRQHGQVWRIDAYDHIVRSEKAYAFLLDYVWDNPDKARLRNVPRFRTK